MASAQTVFIDASFDAVANDINALFPIISNTQADGSGASWDQVGGVVQRGSTANSTGGVSLTVADAEDEIQGNLKRMVVRIRVSPR